MSAKSTIMSTIKMYVYYVSKYGYGLSSMWMDNVYFVSCYKYESHQAFPILYEQCLP